MSFSDMFPALPELHDPVLLVAFEGWNDAGEAATGAADHLLEVWGADWLGEIEPDAYYDFSVHRPEATFDEHGHRQIVFPTTRLFRVTSAPGRRDILVLRGIEPNNRWGQFTEDLIDMIRETDVRMVITLGAMLAETPHTRPVPVHTASAHPELMARLGCSPSTYEGPTGIIGVLTGACDLLAIPTVSLWAAVPHYYAQPPNPKGSLALITALEDVLDLEIPVGDLPEEAHAWETDVDELAADNDEVTGYVQQLETTHDASTPQETSGDEIAREFERYLRRRERG